jgi:hypothetical protein
VSFPIRRIVLAGALIAAGGLVWFAPPYVQSAATLLQLEPVDGIATDDLEVPTRDGRLAARVYRPRETASAHVILFPGIQAGGVDEPRLEALASRLAGAGALVVSVPLPDLRAFRVSGRSTDMIEDATRWMSDQLQRLEIFAPDQAEMVIAPAARHREIQLVAVGTLESPAIGLHRALKHVERVQDRLGFIEMGKTHAPLSSPLLTQNEAVANQTGTRF